VFGIPSVRERVLGATSAASASAPADHTEIVTQADAALRTAEPQALGRADAALQTAIATGTPGPDVDDLRALQAEVLATRAVIHELWGAIEPTMRTDAWFWAQDDAVRAAALLQALGSSGTADRRARADALVRMVQRRIDPAAAVADDEARLLLAATPMLRDEQVKLMPDVLAGLAALREPSVPARLVLALGQHRGGDDEGARATTAAVLADVPEQPAARALARRLAGVKIAEADPPDAPTLVPPDAPDAKTPDAKTPDAKTPDAKIPTKGPPTEGGESAGKLIDRGCSKVEGGSAAEGIEMLKKALEKRPGNGHAALGEHGNALRFYQRALDRSPNMMSALQGAARSAAKLGRKEQAVRLYKRLLEHDPGHDAARDYVKANEGAGGGAGDAGAAGAAGEGSMG
jgi:tetratricopeptide (TPR) repeat protein